MRSRSLSLFETFLCTFHINWIINRVKVVINVTLLTHVKMIIINPSFITCWASGITTNHCPFFIITLIALMDPSSDLRSHDMPSKYALPPGSASDLISVGTANWQNTHSFFAFISFPSSHRVQVGLVREMFSASITNALIVFFQWQQIRKNPAFICWHKGVT